MWPACRTERFKLLYETRNLRRVEDACKGFGDRSPCYVWRGQGGCNSLIQTPGRYQRRGGVVLILKQIIVQGRSDGKIGP